MVKSNGAKKSPRRGYRSSSCARKHREKVTVSCYVYCPRTYCRGGSTGELATHHQLDRQRNIHRGELRYRSQRRGTEEMSKPRLFLEVTRAGTLPVMAAPVIIGSALALQQGAPFQWGLFVLALVGALAAHLGANVIHDVVDFGPGADQAAQAIMPQGNTVATGSQFLLNGRLSINAYRGLAAACFARALLCGIILSFFLPWALAFRVLGFLLAFFYVAPPLRLAYIGRGLGELDILVSFGILPLGGSF